MCRTTTLLAIFSTLLLSACSEQVATPISDASIDDYPVRPALDQLSQADAIGRKARVSNISYVLDIDLVSLADSYQGSVTANFTLTDNDKPLNIDFTGGSVNGVVVNGEMLEPDYNGYFVTLSASALVAGRNEVLIEYAHPFDYDGTGLQRFVDPEDDRTYLYTYL